MARKILFTAERFRKKLQELKREKYVLRQDSIICGGPDLLSEEDFETLRKLGVTENWLNHRISKINLYFYKQDSAKRLTIEPGSNGVAKILFDSIPYSGELVTEDVDYAVGIDDPAEENESTHIVLDNKPIFRDLMIDYCLLPSSTVLWSIFNVFVGEKYGTGVVFCITQNILEEIVEQLLCQGFIEQENGAYISEDNSYWVGICLLDGIKVSYHDRFMSGSVGDFRMEMAEELGISDFATRYYNDWRYRVRLIEGNVDDSVFKYDRINLDDLLRKLHADNYTLDSIGLVNIRSWTDCVTVCGFKNIHDFVYVIFYFDKEKKDFLVEIVSSPEEVGKLQVDELMIPLVHVTIGGFKEVSTFIHGFDLGNFKEHSLV